MDLLTILSAAPNPLFGQQRAYSSGRYPEPWEATEGTYSDIGAITGRAPAIYGFPLNSILRNKNVATLNETINHLVELTNTGVLIEFDWHMLHPASNGYSSNPTIPDLNIASILPGGAYNQNFQQELDYLANFFNQLKENGVSALFRPFHEMNGDWFWWGRGPNTTNTPEEYKTLFNFVADYLGDKDVNNLTYVFAPNVRNFNMESDYNLFYPGDAVDVIGLDMYVKNPLDRLNNLLFLNQFAQDKGKPLALTEFGYTTHGLSGGAEQEVFFSNLAQFMSSFDFAYARTWSGNHIPTSCATRDDFLNNFIPNVSLLVEFDSLIWSVEGLNASQDEGNGAGQLFTFTISRQGDTSGLSLVEWAVAGSGPNSADGADFAGGVLPSGRVYFVAGETSKVITIAAQGDTVIEPDESFTLSLVNPQTGNPLAGIMAQGTILNDDVLAPEFSIVATSADQAEGNSGSNAFTFTVTRSGNATGSNSVNWAVTGTGTNPANATDFVGGVLPSGVVSFGAGETSKLITVNVQGDTTVEPNESFQVTLSNPTDGATITTAGAQGTIQNDDTSSGSAFTGTTGNDALKGTTGADTLVGLAGNDTYTVNNAGDVVTENPNEGTDAVKSDITYTLPDNVEKLTLNGSANLNGTGNALNNTLTGNSGSNTLTGLDGNDTLDGKTGADTVIGGLGNDTYTVDNDGDVVTENLNEGTDTVKASIDYTLGANLENLTLNGSAAINGTGNALNNKLTGNTGANILNGGAGADTLTGKGGDDVFVFQFGQSTITALDRITDFAIGADEIDLLTQGGAALNAPVDFTRAADSATTNINTIVTNVFADADGAMAGNQPLEINSAVLVKVNNANATYLIVNDETSGFQSANDLVINLTGMTGTLPALGVISVNAFFL